MNEKSMSLRTYKILDIVIFSILAMVFEFVGVKALSMYEYPSFAISLFLPITLIVMMRWGYLSGIIAVVSGAIYTLCNNGTTDNYVIYIVGNLFILFNLLWFIKGKKKIRENVWLCVLYVITAYILVCLGRSFVAIFFGGNFINILIGFLGTEALNVFLGIIVVLISRKANGMFYDQIEYIKNVQSENQYQGKE